MKTALLIFARIAATVLAADFVGGLVHWLEDAYVIAFLGQFGMGAGTDREAGAPGRYFGARARTGAKVAGGLQKVI